LEKRIKNIYGELYYGVKSKNELAIKLDVNIKTIENTINKYPEDIILD
jgi:DNA-binding CsgD family transcriptional regulator